MFLTIFNGSSPLLFWHELDSTPEETHTRVKTDQQTRKSEIWKLSHTQVSL